MIHIHKNVTNCYLKFAQVQAVFSMPIWASKQNNRQKTQKLARKSAKNMKNLRISKKFIWIFLNL